ncbi:heat-inducible transcription repressor HrcA [candidate division GN15 bacterium]|nr:heat-inducible transcription repressor HrcA [candidate division GN15 bacterium]
MAFENLTERERRVLGNLIEHYIQSADPVGSRVLAHKFQMGVSSATVRNTLQDLEELGLVEQPHTSAGRVPTDLGYRVYVDYLLKPEVLTEDEKRSIKEEMLRAGRGVKEILGQTARILGDVTNQLGVSIAPRFESGTLRDIRLIPVAEGRLMVVVIVESGLAKSLILEIESNISLPVIQDVETSLNQRLRGLTLSEIRQTIQERMADVSGSARLIQMVVDSKDRIWSESSSDDYSIAGKENLLMMPEFSRREELLRMLRVLEDGSVLSEFLGRAPNEDLVITIGRENLIREVINCSLVTASYKVGNIHGAVGIMGPTRMPYSKAVSIVEYTARSITEVLAGIEQEANRS